ncbi:hypothetical protein H6G89_24040 [Oscillatoria sp. FACHB-1407]|nr:hypothetical protein [Oscillatoria sp. FACHB-1407]MBD2464077.1 hypothetical protein [Oscillatoria sp. FACHB-1407]
MKPSTEGITPSPSILTQVAIAITLTANLRRKLFACTPTPIAYALL